MNKAELIDVLTDKLGTDRRQATAAVENVVDTIVRAVHKGDSVTITGFGVFEQRRFEGRVDPGLGDDGGAVARADARLVCFDDRVERNGGDVALLGEHGFQRAHAQLRFRQLGMVVIVMMVVCHGARV